jgi:hypothetical protein
MDYLPAVGDPVEVANTYKAFVLRTNFFFYGLRAEASFARITSLRSVIQLGWLTHTKPSCCARTSFFMAYVLKRASHVAIKKASRLSTEGFDVGDVGFEPTTLCL